MRRSRGRSVSILACGFDRFRPVAPLLLAAGLLTGCLNTQGESEAQQAPAQTRETRPAPVTTEPWLETMVSVTDLDSSARFFRDIGDYETVATGFMPAEELALMGLAPGASAEFLVLRAPGSSHGFIRLVRFDGVGRKVPARPGSRAWDTGCYWSIMVRAKSMDAIYDEAIALGWWTHTPITYLEFGESRLMLLFSRGRTGSRFRPMSVLASRFRKAFRILIACPSLST